MRFIIPFLAVLAVLAAAGSAEAKKHKFNVVAHFNDTCAWNFMDVKPRDVLSFYCAYFKPNAAGDGPGEYWFDGHGTGTFNSFTGFGDMMFMEHITYIFDQNTTLMFMGQSMATSPTNVRAIIGGTGKYYGANGQAKFRLAPQANGSTYIFGSLKFRTS